MPDVALLDLMQHLSWQPPAIVRPAVVASASGSPTTFEQFVELSEADVDAWALRGRALRERLWQDAKDGGTKLDLETIESMVDGFERSLRAEAREIARFRKSVRRETRGAGPDRRDEVERLGNRMVAASERFFAQGLDFALFLRAMRADADPASRGGPTFDDPEALERYLLTDAA